MTEPIVTGPVRERVRMHFVLFRIGVARMHPAEIRVAGLPAGVTASPLTIGDRDDSRTHGDLVLDVSEGHTLPSGSTLTVSASSSVAPTVTATVRIVPSGHPGTLDETFGENGVLTLSLPPASGYSVYDAGSDYLVTAWPQIVKLRSNGEIRESFGTGGAVELPPSCIGRLEPLDDGGFVTVGAETVAEGDSDLVICRFRDDGSPDGSFGTSGRVRLDFGVASATAAAIIHRGSSLWISGNVRKPGFGADRFFLAKLSTLGALDSTFGIGGVSETSSYDEITDRSYTIGTIALGAGGSIIGHASERSEERAELIRWTPDGRIDTAHGESGFSVGCGCRGGRFFPDGAGGFWTLSLANCEEGGALLGRVTPDGYQDLSFGTWHGCRYLGWGSPFPSASETSVMDLAAVDGAVLLAGSGKFPEHTSTRDFALMRLSSDGVADDSFGTSGVSRRYFGSLDACGSIFNDFLIHVRPSSDGRATVIGRFEGRYVMMRIWL